MLLSQPQELEDLLNFFAVNSPRSPILYSIDANEQQPDLRRPSQLPGSDNTAEPTGPPFSFLDASPTHSTFPALFRFKLKVGSSWRHLICIVDRHDAIIGRTCFSFRKPPSPNQLWKPRLSQPLRPFLNQTPSIYRPLDSIACQARSDIRLLEILPGQDDAPIRCNLLHSTYESSQYEALSYVWGDLRRSERVEINGAAFPITSSLSSALRHLRKKDSPRTLWIDAICINQDDLEERSSQVRVMDRIYADAKQVIVWLGEASVWTDAGFDQFEELQERTFVPTPENMALLSGESYQSFLCDVFQRSWWDRVWVIQEVVVAKRVIVQCGLRTLLWDDLYLWRNLLVVREPFSSENYNRCLRFINQVQYLRKARKRGRGRKCGLLDLVYMFRNLQASDPRDKIYALIGLQLDTESRQIPMSPDYATDTACVYALFAKRCIDALQNLAVVMLAESRRFYGLPSWCPDWRSLDYHKRSSEPASDLVPEPFWDGGLNDQGGELKKKFTATGGLSVQTSASFNSSNPLLLHLKGFAFDTVKSVAPPIKPSRGGRPNAREILLLWEDMSRKLPMGNWNRQEVFLTTITGGTGPRSPKVWQVWHEGGHGFAESDLDHDISVACVGRRFFSTRNGSFGIGPAQTRPGDEVCLLLGAEVPVVLRISSKTAGTTIEAGGREVQLPVYSFIGQTYVHERMHYGSIQEDIASGHLRLEDFVLG